MIYFFDNLHLQIIGSISPKASVENSSALWAILLIIPGVQRGRYTLERKTGCILEAKRFVKAEQLPPPPPAPSSPPVAHPLPSPTDVSHSMVDMVMSIRNDYLDNLVYSVAHIHDKYTLYSPDFLATLPQREARYKVRIMVMLLCFATYKTYRSDLRNMKIRNLI